MAVIANTFTRYASIGIREELANVIFNISPQETPFVSNIGKKTVKNTYFEWQTDVLANAAANAHIDGDDISSYTAVVPTVRLGNYTQIMRKDFILADNLEVINEAGRKSERAYQITKTGNELKRDLEHNLCGLNVAKSAGALAAARKTGGLGTWIKTNVAVGTNGAGAGGGAARTNGTLRAITETILKPVLQATWTKGGNPGMLMVGPHVKTVISGFAGIAAQRYQAPDGPTTIIGAADVYVSDFGSINIVPNRFSNPRDAFVIDTDLLSVATLRPMQVTDLARTGDASKSMTLVEAGLQVDNELGLGAVYDCTHS